MDEANERLRRRTALYRQRLRPGTDAVHTAEYLRLLQYEIAGTAPPETPHDLENLGPAYLRARAQHYRDLATHQRDRQRQRLFRELAASFEKDAARREKRD
ncbi:MAG: hypothetical protein JO032_05080 [Alphaproteobacteria bacterium]|nr:hypothetical protein [Alphaproteobacteria bacterium]MBV9552147.1 hypothetical protein [Alphaproteobacteria bacterium]